ncbi:MAG TPA: hypothetical protein VG146_18635 [Verrucomicrobiae bacterium]|nr:hypothetical protein [Verrucomicrobiae bacterium]
MSEQSVPGLTKALDKVSDKGKRRLLNIQTPAQAKQVRVFSLLDPARVLI